MKGPRLVFVILLWVISAFVYAVSFLAIGPSRHIQTLGLIAVTCLIFGAFITRTRTYLSLYDARQQIGRDAVRLLNTVSSLLFVVAAGLTALYLYTRSIDSSLSIHQNAILVLFGYLSFMAGKWLLVRPCSRQE